MSEEQTLDFSSFKRVLDQRTAVYNGLREQLTLREQLNIAQLNGRTSQPLLGNVFFLHIKWVWNIIMSVYMAYSYKLKFHNIIIYVQIIKILSFQ